MSVYADMPYMLFAPEIADCRKKHIQRDLIWSIRYSVSSEQGHGQTHNSIISKSFSEFNTGQEALFPAHDNDDRPVAACIRFGQMPHKTMLVKVEIFVFHDHSSVSVVLSVLRCCKSAPISPSILTMTGA